VDKYVLLVAVGPTAVSLALALLIRPYPCHVDNGSEANVKGRFQLTYVSPEATTTHTIKSFCDICVTNCGSQFRVWQLNQMVLDLLVLAW
jgi:hypothetical protein